MSLIQKPLVLGLMNILTTIEFIQVKPILVMSIVKIIFLLYYRV